MKNAARVATVLLSFAVAGLSGAVACWPLAPSGGSLPDAAGPTPSSDGATDGSLLADGQTIGETDGQTDGGAEGSAGDGSSDAGDASDAAVNPIQTIATGLNFGCYIDGAGGVWCWGDNTYGQTGSKPSSTPVTTPTQVAGIVGAKAIALGDRHACVVTTAGAVSCWGLNAALQLGHVGGDGICPGTVAGQTVACNGTPSTVTLSTPAVSIQASGAWTCIAGTDGSVQCWGAVQDVTPDTTPDASTTGCGLGNAAMGGTCYPAPYAVAGVTGVSQLAVGFDHACAIIDGGALSCWGNNNEGQISPLGCLPNNTCTPIIVAGIPSTLAVGLGFETTCALGGDSFVRCFGDNGYGQLGHTPGAAGDNNPDAGVGVFNATPTVIVGLMNATALVGAATGACALSGPTVYCWGNVASDAGPGVPVAVPGLPSMSALGTIDQSLACGEATDASIWCWDLLKGGARQLP